MIAAALIGTAQLGAVAAPLPAAPALAGTPGVAPPETTPRALAGTRTTAARTAPESTTVAGIGAVASPTTATRSAAALTQKTSTITTISPTATATVTSQRATRQELQAAHHARRVDEAVPLVPLCLGPASPRLEVVPPDVETLPAGLAPPAALGVAARGMLVVPHKRTNARPRLPGVTAEHPIARGVGQPLAQAAR